MNDVECTCTYQGTRYPCPSHGMANRLPSPALVARLEYEERIKEDKRRKDELERLRLEMSMRPEDV
jgi:hypothetical protein